MNHWVLSAFVYIFGTVRSQPVTEIAVCLLLERNTSTIFDYDRSRAAIEMGVQYVNDNVLPSSHVLTTHYVDIGTSCSAKQHIIGYAMQLRESAVDCNVYVGPGCGAAAEILYDVADFYDTPMIGLPAAAAGISAPFSEYENMVRLSITYTSISDVVAHFLIYQNYTTPVFLQDYDASFFKELNTVLVSVMKERYWDLYRTSKFASIQSPREPNIPLMHTKLRQYAKISRVILWIANADIIRAAMVFLAVELYPSPVWGSFTWRKGDEDDERARSAFGCLLLVSLYRPPTDSSDVFWEDVKRLSLKRYNYTLEGSRVPYLGFLPTFVDDGKVDRLGDLKDWPSGGGQLPPNQPLCGFTGDDPACLVHTGNVAIPVVVSLSLVAVVVVLGALFGVRR
ncbi:hypothetical protein RvY_17921 [Ramazzottius varieornatus]|uniref:Receptor ligand binding region domain-containing protein n=1 Tax=Ramazzottius varieornatus TaxID=947166 RepID=A0A1D1W421_RAMVA|nr:hypothetical protein RvY_17921 [Ramazzottius varieornatus]